jgi:hypothetical protein
MTMGLYINLIVESDDSNIALPNILAVFKNRGIRSNWQIEKNVEACGYDIYERIHEYSDSGKIISGEELYFLITPKIQIIEGMLLAFDEGMMNPWVVVTIRDGCHIEVVSSDESIYKKIRQFYPHAEYLCASMLRGDEFFRDTDQV